MQQIKNLIYSGVSTTSRQNIVYGYLAPDNGINRALLIEFGGSIIKYHQVYKDTLKLIYEDDNFIDKPIDVFNDIINKHQ